MDSLTIEAQKALDSGNAVRAHSLFRAVRENSPRNCSAWIGESRALKLLYRFDEALAALKQVAAIDPNFPGLSNTRDEIENVARQIRIVSCAEYLQINPKAGSVIDLGDRLSFRQGVPPPAIWKLNHLALLGPLTLLTTNDGYILKESVVYDLATALDDLGGYALKAIAPVKLSGSWMTMASQYAENFWHWTMEHYLRAAMAEEAGFRGNYLLPFEPFRRPKYMRESLRLLGITDARIVDAPGYNLFVEEVYVGNAIDTTAGLANYQGAMQLLRDKVLSGIERTPLAETPRGVFISRRDSSRGRIVISENGFVNMLARYNIQRIFAEDLSLREQIELMSGTQILVGAHGAGLVHCLYMPPQSLVIEMFSPNRVKPCKLPIVELLGHEYHSVVCRNEPEFPYLEGENILPDFQLIEIVLKNYLARAKI